MWAQLRVQGHRLHLAVLHAVAAAARPLTAPCLASPLACSSALLPQPGLTAHKLKMGHGALRQALAVQQLGRA